MQLETFNGNKFAVFFFCDFLRFARIKFVKFGEICKIYDFFLVGFCESLIPQRFLGYYGNVLCQLT